MNRYAAAKPYILPTSLARLHGPTSGTIMLPRHIDWGPRYAFDLTDEADIALMYERVIREAQTSADLHAYLNSTILQRLWPDLFLPLPVRSAWQAKFPELGTTAAAA